MKNYVKQLGLQPADRLIVPKSGLRIVQHHAIYLGKNSFGEDLIAENKIGFGVRLISANSFFKDVIDVTEIKRFKGGNAERNAIVKKCLQKVGQPYDLINYNCQHYAYEMQDGIITSPQVENIKDIIGIAAVSLLCISILNTIID